jgi:SAM-dependent methyltransferase
VEHLLDFGDQPVVNKLRDRSDERVGLHPMRVGGCTQCGLVQLTEPVDPHEFYTDYATPSSWKHEPHLGQLLSYLEGAIARDARILEVGCNDGKFLDRLRELGWTDLSGLEPTGNTSSTAIQRGFRVHNRTLDTATASALIDEHGPWDCVVLRQVLEHVSDLRDFGTALHRLLREDGLLVIEVPDSRTNIEGLDYGLWEEHVNCFTPESLDRFLVGHGFRAVHTYTSIFSGVCLTVVARKTARTADAGRLDGPEREASLHGEVARFREWSRAFPGFRDAVHEEVRRSADLGDVVLYGVGARSSTFVNILGLAPYIAYAVDDQLEKQRKYMPQSGLAIHPSEHMASLGRRLGLVMLGVNCENEEAVLCRGSIPPDVRCASVLPPSPRLMEAWSRSLSR